MTSRQARSLLECFVIASLDNVENGSENRTAIRLPMSVPVKARFGGTTHNLMTLNVSVDGAFIVTPQPPERGQLVQLTFILETSPKSVLLQGMVVRTVSGDEARIQTTPAGMGIKYYGLGRVAQTAWQDFFHQALEQYLSEGGVVFTPVPTKASPQEEPSALSYEVPVEFDSRSTPNFYDEPTNRVITKTIFDTTLQTVTEEEISPLLHEADESEPDPEMQEEDTIEQEQELITETIPSPLPEPVVENESLREAPATPLHRQAPTWEPRDQMLVEVSMKPASLVQAEERASQPVLFRIRPIDAEGVHRFKLIALEQGGIVIAGAGRRIPGALAVVAIVHPLSGGEFHIPGEIQGSVSDQQFIPVRFLGVTDHTMREFEHFAKTGSRSPRATGLSSEDPEMVLFYSAEEAQRDFAPENKGAVLIGMMLPFHVASSSGRGR